MTIFPTSPPPELSRSSAELGFDVEHLPRWARLVDDRSRWDRLSRSFSTDELEAIATNPRGFANAAAGTWAAKEAVVKARGRNTPTGVRDVELTWSESGHRVAVCTSDPAAPYLVSLSYSGEFAFAIAWGPVDDATSVLAPRAYDEAPDSHEG